MPAQPPVGRVAIGKTSWHQAALNKTPQGNAPLAAASSGESDPATASEGSGQDNPEGFSSLLESASSTLNKQQDGARAPSANTGKPGTILLQFEGVGAARPENKTAVHGNSVPAQDSEAGNPDQPTLQATPVPLPAVAKASEPLPFAFSFGAPQPKQLAQDETRAVPSPVYAAIRSETQIFDALPQPASAKPAPLGPPEAITQFQLALAPVSQPPAHENSGSRLAEKSKGSPTLLTVPNIAPSVPDEAGVPLPQHTALELKLTERQGSPALPAAPVAAPAALPTGAVDQLPSQAQTQAATLPAAIASARDNSQQERKDDSESADAAGYSVHAIESAAQKPTDSNFTPATVPVHTAKPVAQAAPAAEAHRAAPATLDFAEPTPARTEPARDLSFRIASGTADPIDIKLTDRAGQIHVAVRSSDAALTQSLQTNVSDLEGKLERSGFHTETHLPQHAASTRETAQNQAFQDSSRERRQQPQNWERLRRRNRQTSSTFTLNPSVSAISGE